MDCFDANIKRWHKEYRADMDISVIDCGLNEGKYCGISDLLRLNDSDDWLDAIYSRAPEDLYQLLWEYPISEALQELTPIQKQVLFLNIVYRIPANDIAAMLGCSVRNITKHRQKALESIRLLVTGEP